MKKICICVLSILVVSLYLYWFRMIGELFLKFDFVLIYLNIIREISFFVNYIGVLNIDNYLIFLVFFRF